LLAEHPNEDPDILAGRAARLINDDFGGLHLQRMGRNPTMQHIMRLFLLAPDWTESNVRTMVKMFVNKAGSKEERALYQRFWTGIMWKGAATTTLANFVLAGGDIDEMLERYKMAWEAGNLKFLAVDITPIYESIYEGLGLEPSGERKYFSLIGHFKDPIKFIVDLPKAMHHKGSVVYSTGFEFFAGTDWAGRKFTTLGELIESGGETVTFGPGSPVDYSQFPSYLISQLIGTQPVQIQNLYGWLTGEMEGFDAIAKSMGLGVTTTYPGKKSH